MADTFPDRLQNALKKSKFYLKKKNLAKALECLELALSCFKGKCSSKGDKIVIKISRVCYKLYTKSSTKIPYLRKAEKVVLDWISKTLSQELELNEVIYQESLIILNEWFLYLKLSKNYHAALGYLNKALNIVPESHLKDPDSYELLAKTKLNISGLYSDLNGNSESIAFSEKCLETLQKELFIRSAQGKYSSLSVIDKSKFDEMVTTYILAFYTIAVSQEKLKRSHLAKKALLNAWEIGSKYLDQSNHTLYTIKKALTNNENPISNKLINNFISNDPSAAKRNSRLSLSIPVIDNKLDDPKQQTHEIKTPGKYYSDQELRSKNKKLQECTKLKFISADKYFFQEISKAINVQSDIKHLKTSVSEEFKQLVQQETGEKRMITDLRLKKRYRYRPLSQTDSFNEKLLKLKNDDIEDLNLKKKNIIFISKSFECRKLISMICNRRTRKYLPVQSNLYAGLYFKPKNSFKANWIYTLSNELKNEPESGVALEEVKKKNLFNFQVTKDEIENMIRKVAEEIEGIGLDKGSPKLATPYEFYQAGSSFLSESVLKSKHDARVRFNIIKSSIIDSLNAKKAKRLGNKSKSTKVLEIQI